MLPVQKWNGESVPDLLGLTRLDRDLFCNRINQLNMNASLFGGQVLAQALNAASCTVEEAERPRLVHSLHGYFLRAGRASNSVIYQVERTRDGGSFSTRRVVAIQEGKPIFHMECGFHSEEEGFGHQMPLATDIPGPDQLQSLAQLALEMGERVPPWLRQWAGRQEWPVDVRPVDPVGFFRTDGPVPRRAIWMRVPGAADAPAADQASILAWLSDYWLAGTSALPYAVPRSDQALFIASLDHAMWFHRPTNTSDWLLFDTDSPSAQGGRGLSRALIYTADGRLVATAAQESLMRQCRTPIRD